MTTQHSTFRIQLATSNVAGMALAGVLSVMSAAAYAGALSEYVLGDGTVVSGSVVRTEGPKITLKTTKGVGTYHVMDFSSDTRVKHFDQIEAEFLRQKAERDRKAQDAAGASERLGASNKAPAATNPVEDMWKTNSWVLTGMQVVGGLAVVLVILWLVRR